MPTPLASLGARVPIIFTSRADHVRTRMASCAVAALLATAKWRSSRSGLSRGRHHPRRQRRQLEHQVSAVLGRRTRSAARLLKGQIEGIGVHPRLFAKGVKGETLIDQTWPGVTFPMPAALAKVVEFLRAEIGSLPIAVGHRVVHGGPTTASRSSSTTP
jgi:hypothetical protein